jgi:cytoskeleton protein RodZ
MTKVTRLTLDEQGGLDRRRIHLREISGDLDAPLDNVGQDLRTARLRRGDDLASVSRVLKIRKDHLEALEEDRIDALPGRTYAIGFVRSYADYLGLDAVQCVERFKAEIAGRSDSGAAPITVIDEDAERRMPHGWKIMAGIVLALVVYGAYQLAASVDRALNQPEVAPPPAVMTRPVAHKPKPPVQLTVTQPLTAPVDTNIADPSAAQANNGAQPGAPALQPPGAAPEVLPQGQVYGAQNKNARVILRARQATKILVQGADGRVFLNRTLKPGDTYKVPNIVGMTLTTSDAGVTELDLDGLPMGVLGKSQETAEAVSLDPQSIMDRYNGNHRR